MSNRTLPPFNFFNVLFAIFLILKITHLTDMSWWFVTAPLWGGVSILMLAEWVTPKRR